jgi:hypothetical protein
MEYEADYGTIYFNAQILFNQQLMKDDFIEIYATGGLKYQRFYGEELLFVSWGLNLGFLF